ncbi:hypothetical protein H2200_010248 [Cladophialophora chaetospira]|uniref:Uncharacterized protein n=1 Tax=Cladophialophora chaetospira TaxID=386627 RepID=A0AA38X2F9_9EURO|nr:hypothetical protein H2200_010248 [Cladophialophora chaetospira]
METASAAPKDQTVKIRGEYGMPSTSRRRPPKKPSKPPKQQCGESLGFGIILASKARFAEAKPVLMARATFDLQLRNFLLADNRGYTAGLSKSDLALVQSVVISEIPFNRTVYDDDVDLMVPSLRKLFVYDDRATRLEGLFQEFEDAPSWYPFLKMLRYLWSRARFGDLLRHVKKVAQRNKETAQFVLVERYAYFQDGFSVVSARLELLVFFTDGKQVVYFDLVKEVVWIQSNYRSKILGPDYALPGMIDAIEETI